VNTPPPPFGFHAGAFYIAMKDGLLDFLPLLPYELIEVVAIADTVPVYYQQVLSFLRKKERATRRNELLVCVANARTEQDAGRGEGLHPLLNKIAKLPPEVVREHLVPNYG
jgi:hypothetical protein